MMLGNALSRSRFMVSLSPEKNGEEQYGEVRAD
jgi:hypothetical protein